MGQRTVESNGTEINPEPEQIEDVWNFSNPAYSENLFRTKLQQNNLAREWRVELMTQIARAQGLQRHFVSAAATLDAAHQLITPEMTRGKIRYALERGRLLNSSGHRVESRPYFHEAWELAKEFKEEYLAVDAAHMLGIVEEADQLLKWNFTALEYAEGATNIRARKWLGSLYNNIGWTLHDKGDFEKAHELFQKALDFRKENGNTTTIRIAMWCVARCLRSLNRVKEAYEIQLHLLNDFESTNEKDGFVFEELAECSMELEDLKAARTYFSKAFEELSKDPWFVENESERLKRMKELSG